MSGENYKCIECGTDIHEMEHEINCGHCYDCCVEKQEKAAWEAIENALKK